MTSLDALNEDFRDLLVAFLAHRVEFLVVGAYALAAHGVPRATGDIDILVRPSAENASRVLTALAEFGAPAAQLGITMADLARPGMICQFGLPPRRIDILTEISGLTFDEAWESRLATAFDKSTVAVLGKDALVRNKLASGRPKVLADVDQLRGTH